MIVSIIGTNIFAQLDYLLSVSAYLMASDIHIDIKENFAIIKLRVRGDLQYLTNISKSQAQSIIGRIKVLSNMRLDVSDKSQDGSFMSLVPTFFDDTSDSEIKAEDDNCKSIKEVAEVRTKALYQNIHVRSATAPTVFGENMVCRIFVADNQRGFDLDKIGLENSDLERLKRTLNKDSGLILVSGPTGSGKTTTLYSCLNHISKKSRLIVTLEDPVEVILPHIRQIKVQDEYDFTFADALRGVLRQDPDVIMVGEIRDEDTAKLAVQAALTGHLVLATIHAPSALSIIDRLHSLGVKSDMCAAVISLLISQRHITLNKGRKVVFEIIEFNQKFKSTLLKSHNSSSLSNIIREDGILLLKDRIENLHYEGLISKDELNKYAR